MTPDTGSLRAAARTLDEQAGAVESARSAVLAVERATTWEAAAASRQRTNLEGVDACARTAVAELHAGARHLRSLADACEDLAQAMRGAWSRRRQALQEDLAAAPDEPSRTELRRRLDQLPGPTDPSWAAQVSPPQVPLPSVPSSPVRALPGRDAAAGTVRVDLPSLRVLASALLRHADTAGTGRGRAAGAVVLPFSQLDRYGLPGSRTGSFLAAVTSTASDAGQVAPGWADAAARATALADLLTRADAQGRLPEVLDDARTVLAVDLAVLGSTGSPDELDDALAALSAGDRRWVQEVLPDPYDGPDAVQAGLSSLDIAASGFGAVGAYNAQARTLTATWTAADAAQELARARAVDPALVTRSQYYGRLDAAEALRGQADELARSADDLRTTSRSVPLKVGGALAVAGVAYEISQGKDVPQAVVSGAASFGASVAAGALIGTAIPIPVVGTLVGAVVGAGVGIFVSGAVDSLFEDGPDVGQAFSEGVDAVGDTLGAIGGGISGLFD